MDERRSGSLRVWTPLLFSLILIIGMILGFNLRDILRAKRDINTVIQRNDRLEEIIDLINERYVDSVNTNTLYEDAVNGILKHLDPHTVYIPADQLQAVNEDLEGSFFGIGVEFSIVRDTIEVTSVIKNGPAARAGIQVGDQLIKVGDSTVAGINITSAHIIHMLKGKQHTRVAITIRDASTDSLKHVAIIRDIIPIYSVDADIMLDSITGYIKIDRFSATTYDEFMAALKSLKSKGLKQLIVDLRENPGGYLDAATMIADEFLADNKLIVYTKGLHSPRTDYTAGATGLFEKGKLAILVDESTASAAEILSGAVQDWDRGIIVGRRTFGKGLVQEQYDIDDGSALRLTIAKYYTPSGRCIQRSFANGRKAYEQDFIKRFTSGELTGKDSIATHDTTRYYTSTHRVVYGGGGISPDVYVPYDTARLSTGLLNMLFSEELKTTLWDYFMYNRKRLLQYTSLRQYTKQFDDLPFITNSYIGKLKPKARKNAENILAKPANKEYFNVQVKAQLARFLFHDNGYYAVNAQEDNVVQKTLQLLYSKMYLQLIGR